jgi:excisionase family DNA binding protein
MSTFFREELYRIDKASERLGVSIPNIRNWIYSGKLSTLRTAEGGHRIPESKIRRFLGVLIQKRKEKDDFLFKSLYSRTEKGS